MSPITLRNNVDGSFPTSWWKRRPEMLVFLALTLLFSAPALSGAFSYSLIFLPEVVRAGEWWRLFTHPFVHVTRYHLLLDGAAFFLLYHSLLEPKLARRLAYVVAGGIGSLLLSWMAAPSVATGGLCGLSGIAHGLMAVSAVEMLAGHRRGSAEWRFGLITLVIVVGKAALEALSGKALFGFLYFGLLGDPVAVSHAGGILGSLAAMFLLGIYWRRHTTAQQRWCSQKDCQRNETRARPSGLHSSGRFELCQPGAALF